MWCLERQIHLSAQHLQGVENTVADEELRVMKDCSDRKLKVRVFQQIQSHFPDLNVDLFASCLTYVRRNANRSMFQLPGWCAEGDRDPVSGPIEDVVNFLAHLHVEGYQYHCLHAYMSA